MLDSPIDLKKGSVLFKALSDPSRLRILNLLSNVNEMCISDIEQILEFTQTKTSRHLIYLKNAGLTNNRKLEQWSFYFLTKNYKEIVSASIAWLKEDQRLIKDMEIYNIMYSNRELAVNKLENRKYFG